jgi:hypothetical protein
MYHYDPATALEELSEEAILPNPVRVRVEYQRFFGEAQKLGKEILKQLAV